MSTVLYGCRVGGGGGGGVAVNTKVLLAVALM